MNIKMICLGAMTLSMVAGSALAAGDTGGKTALDDQIKMQNFYSDKEMKTMVGDDDFVKAWKALAPEDRTAMTAACEEESNNAAATAGKGHPDFCAGVKAHGGM